MRIIFWQNCISPHQLPYIIHLVNDERISGVTIVSDCDIDEERKQMGWDISDFLHNNNIKCKIIIQPDSTLIEKLLNENSTGSIHLFSGIRGFKFVFDVFKKSLKYDLYRGIITERPNTYAFGLSNGKPLWLHKLRFYLQDYKYIPYIHFIFAIGEDCASYYRSISKKWEVFPFIYCTPNINIEKSTIPFKTTRFIYIGSLIKRKGVIKILRAFKSISENNDYEFTIVGDGPEKNKLEEFKRKNSLHNVTFIGTKSNKEIPFILQEHDILVLPSIYDGWGAVINEALMQGKYVICSDKCGAKELLDNKTRGYIYNQNNNKQLIQVLNYSLKNINKIRATFHEREMWSKHHINGENIASYMINCITKDTIPQLPWK